MPWWTPFVAAAGSVLASRVGRSDPPGPQPPWYSGEYKLGKGFETVGPKGREYLRSQGVNIYEPSERVLGTEAHEHRQRDYAFGDYERYSELDDQYAAKTQKRAFDFSEQREDNRISRYQALGLTPQEITGAPAPGGQGGTPSTLGRGADFAAKQVGAAAQSSAANTSAAANVESTRIAARAQVLGKAIEAGVDVRGQDIDEALRGRGLDLTERLQDNQIEQIEATIGRIAEQTRLDRTQIENIMAQTEQTLQDTQFREVLHRERWFFEAARTSPETLVALAAAMYNGLSVD